MNRLIDRALESPSCHRLMLLALLVIPNYVLSGPYRPAEIGPIGYPQLFICLASSLLLPSLIKRPLSSRMLPSPSLKAFTGGLYLGTLLLEAVFSIVRWTPAWANPVAAIYLIEQMARTICFAVCIFNLMKLSDRDGRRFIGYRSPVTGIITYAVSSAFITAGSQLLTSFRAAPQDVVLRHELPAAIAWLLYVTVIAKFTIKKGRKASLIPFAVESILIGKIMGKIAGNDLIGSNLLVSEAMSSAIGTLLCSSAVLLLAVALHCNKTTPCAHAKGEAKGSPKNLDSLTAREHEVMQLIEQGKTLKEIAVALHLSPSTIGTYKARALSKLGDKGAENARESQCDKTRALDRVRHPDDDAARPPNRMLKQALKPGLIYLAIALASVGSSGIDGRWGMLITHALAACMLALALMARVRATDDGRIASRSSYRAFSFATVAWGVLGTTTLYQVGNGSIVITAQIALMCGAIVSCDAVLFILMHPSSHVAQEDSEIRRRAQHLFQSKGLDASSSLVLSYLGTGHGTLAISQELHLSPSTVCSYRAKGYKVLGIASAKTLQDYVDREIGGDDR